MEVCSGVWRWWSGVWRRVYLYGYAYVAMSVSIRGCEDEGFSFLVCSVCGDVSEGYFEREAAGLWQLQ